MNLLDDLDLKQKKPLQLNLTHRKSCSSLGNHDTCSPTHDCCEDVSTTVSTNKRRAKSLAPLIPSPTYRTQYRQGSKTRLLRQSDADSNESSSDLVQHSSFYNSNECINSNKPPSFQQQPMFIDFPILDKFVTSTFDDGLSPNQYYKPVDHTGFFSCHRPLVPQSILQSNTYAYHDDFSTCFIDGSFEKSEENQTLFEQCVQKHIIDDESSEKVPDPDTDLYPTRRMSFSMNRFVFFDNLNEMKREGPVIGALLSKNETFEDIFNNNNNIWWLDCLDPTPVELKTIGRTFGIHPLTIDDIKQKETHEKVEIFKSYYFLCFNSFNNEKDSEQYLVPISIYLVVFKEGVISFHFTPICHTSNVRRRVRDLRRFVKVSSDWLCYAILNDITDSFVPIIKKLEVEIDFIEESVYLTRKPDFHLMIRRIGENRNIVNLVLRLLSRKADVVKMFAKRYKEQHTIAHNEEIDLYLGDIQDHIITMKQSLSVYEKMLSRSHSNYLAQLQVESVDSNNRVTKVLGRITLIGTVLVPLNLVTGLFGMNVRVPGQNGEDLKWFFGMIGFIVALIIIFSVIANSWIVEAEKGETMPDQQKTESKKLRMAAGKFNPFWQEPIHKNKLK